MAQIGQKFVNFKDSIGGIHMIIENASQDYTNVHGNICLYVIDQLLRSINKPDLLEMRSQSQTHKQTTQTEAEFKQQCSFAFMPAVCPKCNGRGRIERYPEDTCIPFVYRCSCKAGQQYSKHYTLWKNSNAKQFTPHWLDWTINRNWKESDYVE